ncbi:unnamed protein product [Adineta ricciae]|uniref:Intersectin-1 n=1 Tax=Adineta ricciae TaxID=249248 RepID=A0A814CGI9_ADIRI|nr:unnamed protein product [Adineta ricciae]
MAGDWRISADDRTKYDSYFQQCNPIQGYVTGEQARSFFVQSGLPADVLRKIWDLSDITADGRLDKREFTIACHLIASQVQKKVPLPATLPPTLLSDAIIITANSALPFTPAFPTSITPPGQPLAASHLLKPAIIPPSPLTPASRSKYLQQFHSLVDVTKTNGFMTGSQAKNILQQTGLSQTYLHQIWNLADIDKDGRLTPDEFVVAMHCCDIVRAGQTLPTRLPDEWLQGNTMLRDQTGSLARQTVSPAFATPHQDLRDAFSSHISTENHTSENSETERRNSIVTYEEKRQKNYEDGFKEIERRRQMLREQEEREQKCREERERKRELDLQKQKEEQERKKQLEFERQLARQQQIEQQREEERRKLFEQREAARKEMERKSRLEWERQRLQELSAQKSRLLEQINDVKSRGKALELELQSMGDTIQARQTKINQTNTNIQTMDQSIDDIQRRALQDKNLLENVEQQKKETMMKLHRIQTEKESITSSLQHLNQSKEFSTGSRESDQLRFAQLQLDNMKQENVRLDEQIATMNHQCKQYQNQMEQLRLQLSQLEQSARNPKPSANTTMPTTALANYDQFHASNDYNPLPSSIPIASPSALDVDPFQTVDPFASQSDLGSPSTTETNNVWFQSPTNGVSPNDPFLTKPEFASQAPKSLPKTNGKQASVADPWGSANATNNNGAAWDAFSTTNSPFGTTANEWPQPPSTKNGNASTGTIQYRALYDYVPERSDEIAVTAGDIITKKPSEAKHVYLSIYLLLAHVDPTQQQDENWLFGRTGNGKEGFFPSAYAEPISSSTPSSTNENSIDTTSQLISGSWAVTVADYQGKTVDKHLSFQKGEMILVREQKDATWYSGQLNRKVGWFPRSYVRPATEVEIQNNKNTAMNTPTTPSSTNAFAPPNGVSSNGNGIADVYVSIYPYEATDPGDLTFDVNERITVLQRDGDWWTGKIGTRVGTFPSNYVQKVDNPLQETVTAINSFHSKEENRLSFERGQLIYIRKKGDKGWYQGEIRGANQPIQVGWFPASCVHLQNASSPSTPTATYQNTQEYPRYVANFAYEAQQDDELSFPADAILEILDQGGSTGWFKARYNNQTGLVPSTYVKPLEESTPFSTAPQHLPSDPSRVSAIRELIETEQRYVDDLFIVANDFIKPLNNARILSDYEIEQIFINWISLIALNSTLLSALQEQVNYKEDMSSTENGVIMRTPRSASLSNIQLAVQLPSRNSVSDRHRSHTPEVLHSPTLRRLKHFSVHHNRSPSSQNLALKGNMEHLGEPLSPPSPVFQSSASMTINESTKIGDILCLHLPSMVNDYFQYCSRRSQANKSFQAKCDSNEHFRSQLQIFQDKTGGLSLNGFLTKPIQRVTRYPLLIEKVLKHTSEKHADYASIKQALECARQLNERINKQISEQESSSRLDWLQQHLTFGSDENCSDGYLFDELLKFNSLNRYHIQRQLLLHGLVLKVPSGKELLGFLFNDFLLFATMKSSSNWQTQLFERRTNFQLKLYRMPIFLTDIIIANDLLHDQFTFSITTKVYDKPLQLKTQQTNVRTLWVKSINNAVEECQVAEKSILADKAMFTVTENKRDSKTAVARLLLVVQEAQDLVPAPVTAERHRSVDPYCEITIGALTLKTSFAKRTTKPKWNAPMQFLLYNLVDDIIHINIFDNEFFSPNENLGSTSIHLGDILPCPLDKFLTQPSLPFTQKLYLNNGASLVIKCTVQLLTS